MGTPSDGLGLNIIDSLSHCTTALAHHHFATTRRSCQEKSFEEIDKIVGVITCPVSRALPSNDPARTIAFYRDVLGFEHRDDLLFNGPAELSIDPEAAPRVIYFEVDDVAPTRASIEQRGASPGPIGNANWIKIEMFEVHDPSGNVLL